MRWKFLILLGLTVLTPLAGCGKTSDRALVSGKVTYLGEPVANGEIRFDAIGGTTQPTGASIRDGRYEVVGKGGVPIQYLPPKYNTNSELTAALEPGETKKTLDFDLK